MPNLRKIATFKLNPDHPYLDGQKIDVDENGYAHIWVNKDKYPRIDSLSYRGTEVIGRVAEL